MLSPRANDQLAEDYFASIEKTFRGLRAVFFQEMRQTGVTLQQFQLLMALRFKGDATITEISQSQFVSAPTASRMIDSLCTKGLLKKRKDPSDHRVTRLNLTSESQRLIEHLSRVRDQLLVKVFEEETPESLQRTVDHISAISDRWLEVVDSETGEE